MLEKLRPALITQSFEGGPDEDPYRPIFAYIVLDTFRSSSGFDVDALATAVFEAFARLLSCVPIIDEFFESRPAAQRAPRVPQTERHLRFVAVLDTETAGALPNAKMTELGIVLAAYDDIGDQVVGIVEEYSFEKPKNLDQSKVQALLDRAEAIVAHNEAFDRTILESHLPGIRTNRWICSYRGIDWKALNGVGAENLHSLLQAEGLRPEQDHHALAGC